MGEKRKVVVTGGAGFIGSHTVDRLLKDGCRVVVIDNFTTGRLSNLEHHRANEDLEIIQADINDHSKTRNAYQGAEWVIHLAALADIVPSIENPLSYHHSNVSGTVSVLELSRAAGVRRFIYAASSSCYGIPDCFPTSETSEIRPQYPYALTKYLGEQYVMDWGKVYKLPVVSLRFFNVYGPRSRTSGTYGAVFGVFLAQKLKSIPYTVVGDGTQSRDFTFVTDVVSAVIAAAESDVKQEIMNVGSGGHYAIRYLVELLGGPITFIPKRPGEPDRTFADTRKIREKLGWAPTVSFEQGVQAMLNNIDYWKNAPVWTPDTINNATKTWFQYLS